MQKILKAKLKSHEFFILAAIVLLGLLIPVTSGQFFDSNNLVDILRACITSCTFALGTYMVIIAGGIDLSLVWHQVTGKKECDAVGKKAVIRIGYDRI